VIKFNKRTDELESVFDDKKTEVNKFTSDQGFRKKLTDLDIAKFCAFYDSLL
jgi:hypothetical protein